MNLKLDNESSRLINKGAWLAVTRGIRAVKITLIQLHNFYICGAFSVT